MDDHRRSHVITKRIITQFISAFRKIICHNCQYGNYFSWVEHLISCLCLEYSYKTARVNLLKQILVWVIRLMHYFTNEKRNNIFSIKYFFFTNRSLLYILLKNILLQIISLFVDCHSHVQIPRKTIKFFKFLNEKY